MRFIFNNSKYKDLRKVLRNNKTDVEDILWQYLRHSKLGFKFRRQASIGRYVVDFYCPSEKLVIELDGSHHMKKDNKEYDKIRTEYFHYLNIAVLRFKNNDIKDNINDVIGRINKFLKNK